MDTNTPPTTAVYVSPRSSTSSDRSFVSGRSSPLNGFDSSAALILVADSEDDAASPAHSGAFAFASDDDEELDAGDLALERLRASSIPPLPSASVFLYLLAPYLKLGALLVPATGLPARVAVPALLVFAALSAFARQIWYMLARYVRRADVEEIVLETFARGRGKEGRRLFLRQSVRFAVGAFRVLIAALYLRFSVDMLLPYFPDALSVSSRIILTIIVATFIAPVYSAHSLASRSVIYASWISVACYAIWFFCTTYMHAKHIMVPVAFSSSLGKLWYGIPALAFAFTTSSTVPLYASLKGTVDPLNNKSGRLQSFKLLSVLSLAVTLSVILPLAFFGASLAPRGLRLPSIDLQATVAVFGAGALIFSIPSILITAPALPLPLPRAVLRTTSFPLSKVLTYFITLILALLPDAATRACSDIALLLAFLNTYALPAALHIVLHQVRRPLAIVVPPTTPTVALAPSPSLQDELLQAKERALQRRRLWRRLVWDVGVWVLLLPIGGGGTVWAAGRVVGRW